MHKRLVMYGRLNVMYRALNLSYTIFIFENGKGARLEECREYQTLPR